MIHTLSREHIQDTYADKGYDYFTKGNYNLNFFGIRNSNGVVDKFNDSSYLGYSVDGKPKLHWWPFTTDPGLYWMRNPMKRSGCGAMVEGQYLGLYDFGRHRGKYYAPVQMGKCKAYRDNNKDEIFDYNPSAIEIGNFHANIHKAGKDSEWVGKWSALCQVFKRAGDFNQFMSIYHKSAKLWGYKLTYTLFNSNDFMR